LEIFAIWQGGMSFHGGLIGVLLAIGYFAHRFKISSLTIGDIVATVCPFAIFLVRIGNFINSEIWGRPTDVPWAVVFPAADSQPRHPSQLYESASEGLLLLLVLGIFARNGALKRPGLLSGLFLAGYALARTAMEFFREPDAEIEQLGHGLTMGMVLSAPMLAIGIALVIYSGLMARRLKSSTERHSPPGRFGPGAPTLGVNHDDTSEAAGPDTIERKCGPRDAGLDALGRP
jgi:phosphatidylglycerol---prolipoprotein diacylglyceryl transferase